MGRTITDRSRRIPMPATRRAPGTDVATRMAQTRRAVLGAVGGGCLAGGFFLRPPSPRLPEVGAGADLPELVTLVQRTPRSDLLARAVQLHQGGVHWRDLLAAAFLAGIHD